ncbi:unnamed protein product (macronuclear) [Paramecium tetraurelia]|uniref:Uncharacterized protein n=1 Tax=Paramecium tetraurelia TaxID=5888 RepID=A0EFQ4_PARTE|nr:uncharacterized protein GSPATT00026468001 [Paramecium tetraurelia]CAK94145.1 unnamed protein product [Paramecium tetraurelia]|eukprot:XP_001461518.1 hypothetical protein (macronuclear) [Paramecium tetraurelia strain d4-2]
MATADIIVFKYCNIQTTHGMPSKKEVISSKRIFPEQHNRKGAIQLTWDVQGVFPKIAQKIGVSKVPDDPPLVQVIVKMQPPKPKYIPPPLPQNYVHPPIKKQGKKTGKPEIVAERQSYEESIAKKTIRQSRKSLSNSNYGKEYGGFYSMDRCFLKRDKEFIKKEVKGYGNFYEKSPEGRFVHVPQPPLSYKYQYVASTEL